jgi:hypothetical protein
MNAHTISRLLIAFAAFSLLAGCASVSSRSIVLDKASSQHDSDLIYSTHEPKHDGLTYYLPMRYAEATFRREYVDSTKAETDHKAAIAAESTAKTEATNAAGALKQAETRTKAMRSSGLPADADKYQEVILAEIDARLKSDAASAAYLAAQTKLASAQANADAARNQSGQCGYVDSFNFVLQKPMPDLQAKYVLRMTHSWMRNDEWRFKTTPQGLLSTVDGINDDQSAQILVALAQAYAATASGPNISSATAEKMRSRDFSLGVRKLDLCDDYAWKPLALKLLIDPTNHVDLESFSSEVNAIAKVECKSDRSCTPIKFAYSIAPQPSIGNAGQSKPDVTTSSDSKGVFYRRELPLRLQVDRRDNISSLINANNTDAGINFLRHLPDPAPQKKTRGGTVIDDDETLAVIELLGPALEARNKLFQQASNLGEARSVGSILMLLPNHAPTDHLALPAGGFVKTEHGVEFDQGMLVSVSSKRPSELLRVASTPWEIARATMGVLGDIVHFKVDYASQDAALIEQQTKQLEQLRLQLDAREALDNARAGHSDDTP